MNHAPVTALTRLLPALLLLLLLATSARAQTLPSGYTSALNVPYVTNGGDRQRLDIYYPTTGDPVGLVVWIHGGGWNTGSKQTNQALGLLAHERLAIASINYRLTTTDPFPAQIQDVKSALRFLRANAATYRIDTNRVGLWGRSAGAHLAALAGTTGDNGLFDVGENLAQSSRVQAVVDFFGPTNLALYGNSTAGDELTLYLGATVQSNPASLAQSNPINHINGGGAEPPFLIMHRTGDPVVPVAHSQSLHDALRTAGVPSTLRTFSGNSHDLPNLTFGSTTPYDAEVATFFRNSFQAVPEPSTTAAVLGVAGLWLRRSRWLWN